MIRKTIAMLFLASAAVCSLSAADEQSKDDGKQNCPPPPPSMERPCDNPPCGKEFDGKDCRRPGHGAPQCCCRCHCMPPPPPPECGKDGDKKCPQPPPQRGMERRDGRMGMMPAPKPEELLARFPEADRARLQQLMKDDPKAFRAEVREYFRKEREKEMGEFLAARKAYLEAKDEASKAEAEKTLRTMISAQQKRHVEMSEKRIAAMEDFVKKSGEQVEKLKKELEEKKAKSAEEADQIFKVVTDPSKEPPFCRKPGPKGPEKK